MNRSRNTILRCATLACLTSAAALSLAAPAGAGPLTTQRVSPLQKINRSALDVSSSATEVSIFAFNSVIGGVDSIAVYVDRAHCVGEYFSVDQRFLASGRHYGFMISYSGDVATDHIPGVLSPTSVFTPSVGDMLATKLVAWGAGGTATVSVLDDQGVEVASRRVPVFVNGGAAPNQGRDAVRRYLACDPGVVARISLSRG